MITFLLSLILLIAVIILVVLFVRNHPLESNQSLNNLPNLLESLNKDINRIETSVKEEIKSNRQELANNLTTFQSSFNETLATISKSQLDQLKMISDTSVSAINQLNKTIEDKLNALIQKTDTNNLTNREELSKSLKEFQDSFDKNVKSFNDLQRDNFTKLEIKQGELITSTELKLEKIRETVDEKLQKTLNERLGQSFELVSKQLESVQKGLGEMQNLATDVGGLKKILGNVKMRGGLGETRLEMLLEQILSPQQYSANVKTKRGSNDLVEFAIKLPGKNDQDGPVYLPIDAKFPQDAYHSLVEAYDIGDTIVIDSASKNIENVIKKMAKDIKDKYIDPPYTTDFAIMFLPFEGLYAEIVRRSDLLESLQRDYKIVITGPTTLAAILNSLQMGFKTLAIQQRSSEVWNVLGAVKTEFEKFGGLLEKTQKNLHLATNQLDELVGKRTKAIQRRLKDVESLPAGEAINYLPASGEVDSMEDEEEV